ncbi:hypothetical protein [Chondromyces apiculatus]|uniref:Uncharacterized protein n=1 Tax=Chondromyces apiculatus DSM 436 TaxID=1192034 RepID=A0A017T3M1_9BACT|nr:hypothetical protein [Chondromyces apiculatus]EYF03435.1 Hypothetical protein CAP_5541 [Chondromyces apiculatus DSM 436]
MPSPTIPRTAASLLLTPLTLTPLTLTLTLLASCTRDDPKPAPPASSAITAAPQPSALLPSAAPSSPPTSASSAAPAASSAAAASPPAANITRSARPTPIEWCRAPIATLGYEGHDDGDTIYACKMIEVREWMMLWCPMSGARMNGKSLGSYDRALPGGGSMATPEEIEAATTSGAADAVIVSLRPGTKAKPSFIYRPADHPDWTRNESFTLELPATAQSLADRLWNGGPWPTLEDRTDTSRCDTLEARTKADADARKALEDKARAEADQAQATEDAKGVPDLPDLAPPPADEAWTAQKEALVTGSDALGCKTKLLEPWFWLQCEGKTKLTAIDVEKGRHATQTRASAEAGVIKLLTPYVEGTDLRARLSTDDGDRFLKISWPKGKRRPFQTGSFTDKR